MIDCAHKLTCVCACMCVCNRMRLKEQTVNTQKTIITDRHMQILKYLAKYPADTTLNTIWEKLNYAVFMAYENGLFFSLQKLPCLFYPIWLYHKLVTYKESLYLCSKNERQKQILTYTDFLLSMCFRVSWCFPSWKN